MNIKIKLNKGLNFIITDDMHFQEKMQIELYRKGSIIMTINGINVPFNDLKKSIFWVNKHEKSFFKKRHRFNRMIDTNSEIVTSLDIQPKVFNLKLKQLWHWSYLCSCAIGISKGKKLFVFPWISSIECSVQSYRFLKLYEYAITNDLTILIPTNDLSRLELNKDPNLRYNVIG